MDRMDEAEFETLLKLGAKECLDADVAMFNALDVSDIEISPKTTKRILRAIRQECGRSSAAAAVKRAAMICLVTLSVLFASAMCIEPVRAAVWDALVSWYDKYIGISFVDSVTEDTPDSIETVLMPDVPEGWEVVELVSDPVTACYLMYGTQGEYVTYQQMVASDGEVWMDNDCTVEEIRLNDQYDAYLCTYEDGRYTIVWEKRYVFTVSGENIALDVLVDIAESVNRYP